MKVLDQLRNLTIGRLQPAGELAGEILQSSAGLLFQQPKRLQVVFARPLTVARDFVAVLVPKSSHDRDFLERALNEHIIFADLTRNEKQQLVNAMELVSYKQNTTIIQQGDVGDYLYIILDGTCRYTVDGHDVGQGAAGDVVGELALLYDCPRAATVVAESSECRLYRVSQVTFRRICAAHVLQNDHETRVALRQLDMFQSVPDLVINHLADSLFLKRFQQGELLVEKGQEATSIFIIKEGFVVGKDISIGSTEYANVRMGPGDHFGERAIASGTPLVGTVEALSNGAVWILTKERFLRILGHLNLKELTKRSGDSKLLAAIPLIAYSDVDPVETDLMASKIVDKKTESGTVVAKAGQMVTPAFYLIRSGAVTLTSPDGTSKELYAGEIFVFGRETLILTNALKGQNKTWKEDGLVALTTQAVAYIAEQNLLNNKVKARHTVVVKNDETELGMLTLEDIGTVLHDILRLGREQAAVDKSVTKDRQDRIRILGAGSFGQVWLTRDKNTKSMYAMKIQYKRELLESGQDEGVIREKQVMEQMHHPFVMRIVNAEQDAKCLYMILDLLQGGELHSQMQNSQRRYLSEDSARFYGACILEGLSYMHRRMFVYRDLKGENVLLDKDGYCVIVDLGFAKFVPDKTFTFCGTPVFIAPEVIRQRGHNKSADIWSFGVLLYEMLVGNNPFYDYWGEHKKGFDQRSLFKRIMSGTFEFPRKPALSRDAKDLITKLLTVDPAARLGCLGRGDLDIRDHKWFKSIDFGKLYRKELSPPWTPPTSDPGSNFAKWEAPDKSHLKPLNSHEQERFKDF